MPSLKSRLIIFAMRNMHLLHFHLKKEEWDWNTSVINFRQKCEKSNSVIGKMPDGIEVSPLMIDNIYAAHPYLRR